VSVREMFRDEPHQCLTGEVENYSVDLFDVTVMELDGGQARASLESLRLV
jgi:hypothetical protein